LAPILLLGAFLEVTVSLSSALSQVDLSNLPGLGQVSGLTLPTVSATQVAAGTGQSWYSWAIIPTTLALVFVLLVLVLRRHSRGGDGFLWRLLGLVVALSLYPALVVVIKLFPAWGENPSQDLVLTTALLTFGALLAAAVVMVGLTLYERSKARLLTASLESNGSVQAVQRLVESLRARLYSAKESEACRDAVISCYSAMTGLLASHGVGDRPSFTPRELQTSAGRTLKGSQPEIDTLTRLFEKARYDKTPVKPEEARESLNALGRIASRVQAGREALPP
jgi:Domain of unknown function (DUF4129)